MNRTRTEMRDYQRMRRARIRAEREAEPVVDKALPRDAIMKAGDHELKPIWAKAAAIGPGAVITKTNGRFDVLSRDAFEARHAPLATHSTPATAAPPTRPPASMIAIGGRPGRGLVPQGQGMPAPPDIAAMSTYTRAEEFRAKTESMLAALAAKSDQQERRLAALEAADRRAHAIEFVQTIFGLFNPVAFR